MAELLDISVSAVTVLWAGRSGKGGRNRWLDQCFCLFSKSSRSPL